MRAATLNAEKIFTLSEQQLAQTTLICDDAFLSHFVATHIQKTQTTAASQTIHLDYHTSQHASISTQLISQSLFQDDPFHILTVKGTDLKHPPLKTLLEAHHKPILIKVIKLSPAQRQTKLFQQLKKQTTLIETKALSEKKTILWTQGLLKYHQIRSAPRIIEALCQKLDWDLSGIAQLVQQLTTNKTSTINTLEQITPLILTTHQAPIFSLLDQLFNGKRDDCVTFFQKYQHPEILQKIYWLSMRRLQEYLRLQEKQSRQACDSKTLLQQEKVWAQLQPQYQRALRLPTRTLQNLYLELCEKEWTLKGLQKGQFASEVVHTLLRLCTALADKNTYPTSS